MKPSTKATANPESRMREIRLYGSEGGRAVIRSPYPYPKMRIAGWAHRPTPLT